MPDPEVPASAAAAPAAAAPAPARRSWPWVVGALVLLFGLIVLATTLTLLGLLDAAREGLTFWVDGQPWRLGSTGDWDIDEHTVAGAFVAALLVVIVVPLVVLAALVCAVMAVCLALLAGTAGVALALGLVLLVLVLALAPVWGLALLLWLVWRSSTKGSPPKAAAV